MLAHLISFYSSPEPKIIFWKNKEIHEEILQGEYLIKFSDKIFCTGYYDEEKRNQCLHTRRGRKQCYSCAKKDISNIYTCLDFTGYEHLEEEYCKQPFSLYLAQFGNSILKCGVTKTERIQTRTMEQGADFWVELARFDNANDVYKMEETLQNAFTLDNAVTHAKKLQFLNEQATNNNIKQKLRQIAGDKDFRSLCLPELNIVKNEYKTPEQFTVSERIDGKVIGSKSKLLFYGKNNQEYVVNMARMEGRIFIWK